jgi:hypothetical protein
MHPQTTSHLGDATPCVALVTTINQYIVNPGCQTQNRVCLTLCLVCKKLYFQACSTRTTPVLKVSAFVCEGSIVYDVDVHVEPAPIMSLEQ